MNCSKKIKVEDAFKSIVQIIAVSLANSLSFVFSQLKTDDSSEIVIVVKSKYLAGNFHFMMLTSSLTKIFSTQTNYRLIYSS